MAKAEAVCALHASGGSPIAREVGIGRASVYRILYVKCIIITTILLPAIQFNRGSALKIRLGFHLSRALINTFPVNALHTGKLSKCLDCSEVNS